MLGDRHKPEARFFRWVNSFMDGMKELTKKGAVCGESPVAPITGLCGSCTFREAETADGNGV